ncbi:MAG: aldose 1-epimerase [Halieaceae bacterium]|jgi:aldose 1-epimerase
MELESAHARVRIDPSQGGRLASLQVFGHELLVTAASNPLHWGSYPMAPWAGRIRHGRFRHAGKEYRLPLTMPPHAIHGTVWGRGWEQTADDALAISLGEDWPFAGRAEQRFTLQDDSLCMELAVYAQGCTFPASIGWHPYFLRDLGAGGRARLLFSADAIYADDHEQIPTGELISPPAGPWDNCFTQVQGAPGIRWPGIMELALHSDLDHWVIYDLLDHALCVEPMSGPPNALNMGPRVVTPEMPLKGRFEMHWRRHAEVSEACG